MNIQKEKTLFIAFLENEFPITVADLKSQGIDLLGHFNTEWETWQAAKAVPEGFVLVEKCDIEMMLQLIDNSLGYKSAPNKDDTMKIVKNMLIQIGEANFEGGVLSGN